MADAGRAMMLYRGLYESTHTYEKLDVVNFNGSLYISTTDGNLGTEPTDGTKWKLFLQGGADNIQATDTHGLVGDAGSSSFVQTLLDGIAEKVVNIISGSEVVKKATQAETATKATQDGNGNNIVNTYVNKSKILDTAELISANTASGNVAGALGVKEIISLINHFTQSDGKTPRYNGNSLDDINVNSVYESDVGTSGNAPANGWGYVLTFIHYSSTVHRIQMYVNLGTAKVYTRRCLDDVWSAWLEFADLNSTVARATADANGNNIEDTYMPYGGYYDDTVSINDMTSVGIHRKYLKTNNDDSVYLGGNIGGQIAIIVTREAGYIRQYIIGFSDSVAGKVWWRQNKTQGTLSLSYEDKLCTYNGAVNGIEFSIVNGELKYSYDKSIWGE